MAAKRTAVPKPEHYPPLFYVVGTRTPSEPLTFPVEGVDGARFQCLPFVWAARGDGISGAQSSVSVSLQRRDK